MLPGPMPRETIQCLVGLDIPVQFIRGNGDREVLARMRGGESSSLPEQARTAIRWVAEQLTSEDETLLAQWPAMQRIQMDKLGDIVFCHATPRNDTEIFTAQTAEEKLVPVFARADAAVVICGHTHMQFERRVGTIRVVNAGSVGMPFGEAGAYWLLLGPDVEFRRTAYDLEKAAQAVRATAFPGSEEFAARNVLEPPSKREMLEAFGRVELR